MNKPLRTVRLIACGFFATLEELAGHAADILAIPPETAFKTNDELDATFTEGEHYSGTRPGFIP